MANFFSRMKKEKDLKFDFFIGIWSAVIIIVLLAIIGLFIYYVGFKKDSTSGEDTEVTATATPDASPEATEEPAGSTVNPTRRPSFENLDSIDTDDLETSDDGVMMLYAVSNINVRSDASTTSSIVGKLTAGGSVKCIKKLDNGWTKVDYNGKEAYVKSELLTPNKNSVNNQTDSNNVTSAPATKAPAAKATKKPSTPKSTKKPAKATQKPESTKVTENPEPIITEAPVITEAPIMTEAPKESESTDGQVQTVE